MAKELFIERSFKPETLAIIKQANVIVVEYQKMGFSLTLRQLYYQFVARALLDNKQTEYKRLGSIINDARLAGLIDWSAIEDRTRNVREAPSWADPQSILDAIAEQYQEDPWLAQDYAPEIWIEKDALIGVIEPICTRMRVPYFACRGNVSQSEVYGAAGRLAEARRNRKIPIVFHLGDHDPNGVDMTRDNQERLSMFARFDVEVQRLALNMDQIQKYDPPEAPAKDSDSRISGYAAMMAEHGYKDPDNLPAWELDALDPPVIEALIQDALDEIVDKDAWEASMAAERASRVNLSAVADRWDEVTDFLDGEQ